jgi:hypothetical protein
LAEAIEAAAEAAGCESADLFAGKPKQAKKYATLVRMVHQKGEGHRLQVHSLHRIPRAAGLALEDIYDADELTEAGAHEGERVSVRIRACDVVADLPKSRAGRCGAVTGSRRTAREAGSCVSRGPGCCTRPCSSRRR